ncbi:hypothetical protein ABIF29_008169 [Bradyrhizobium elkanii]|uniref:Uncharacterized protein n=1 Tax=Bradyrhizobium elkanii TaxID=29448 RepID=A0ABV4FD09_BRAEL
MAWGYVPQTVGQVAIAAVTRSGRTRQHVEQHGEQQEEASVDLDEGRARRCGPLFLLHAHTGRDAYSQDIHPSFMKIE